jgi:hypothetical protein
VAGIDAVAGDGMHGSEAVPGGFVAGAEAVRERCVAGAYAVAGDGVHGSDAVPGRCVTGGGAVAGDGGAGGHRTSSVMAGKVPVLASATEGIGSGSRPRIRSVISRVISWAGRAASSSR